MHDIPLFYLSIFAVRPSEKPRYFQTGLDSNFKCSTQAVVVGADSRIKHLAFHSQVFFLAGGSAHPEPCVFPAH
ncbi:hypothetical protein BV912_02925 [Neisseria dumasiana]|uniref:Uncharacterized protein n=1 Tax=Neisseria dumasiana TaxID=1931275 RepID=A0A1X3DKU0_9NEIS|nr:hypothetical protein BV912_02925 [Neisseria dumasiana]